MTDVALGTHIATLREKAGIKQNELARRLDWSPAVLSRVESGERSLTPEERSLVLRAIGTPEAAELDANLSRQWDVLVEPRIGHPDQALLWEAENALRELAALEQRPDMRSAFARRLKEYQAELLNHAARVNSTAYNAAFIGSIGVGKSTALCRFSGLEAPSGTSGLPSPVLEVGGGGITVCEVHVRQGPGYGILVEPRTEEDIRREVMVFAEFIWNSLKGNTTQPDAQEDDEGADALGISKEVVRAIRNMSGLKVKREKVSGKTVRTDEARILAEKQPDVHALAVEMLTLMALPRRDRRDLWHDPKVTGKPGLVWLRDTFEQVNNGRHPEVALPRRIEINVPWAILGSEQFTIRLIDTKGIDQTAARADLESHFGEDHTVTILCSRFNDAPETPLQNLLLRAVNSGTRHLDARSSVLVLPRPGEASAMKQDDGQRAENAEEGYELKEEQAAMRLQQVHQTLASVPLAFFNSLEDDPARLQAFVLSRIDALRNMHRETLREIIRGARSLVENFEKAQVQEIQAQAARHLAAAVAMHSKVTPSSDVIQDELVGAIRGAHASTVRASVRREGEWHNLQYSHHIGYGARKLAAAALEPARNSLTVNVQTMLHNPEMDHARDLLEQTSRVLETGIEDILQKAQLLAQATYLEAIKIDHEFWSRCLNEWGMGPGYRDRVLSHNHDWFGESHHRMYGVQIAGLIEREWAALVEKMNGLLEVE